MACKCTTCCYWHPKDWDGSKGHWADTIAKCEIHNSFKTFDNTCESASIVRPRATMAQVSMVGASNGLPTEKKPKTLTVNVPEEPAAEEPKELFAHQKEAYHMFCDAAEGALFMEMGTGKSATALRIASHKFKTGQIDALLIIAPNDVHTQWAKEQIPLWLDCAYDIQCLFGRGGQKVAYPFDNKPYELQVVVVNIDTFSTPLKWKDIVDWANSKKTMIILDEATVIKSIKAQRTQRMLYAFNNVVKRGKAILSSKSRSAARFILTGTPVTNGPMDMWAMMEFIHPNYFNRNWYSFQNHFGLFTKITVHDKYGNPRLQDVPLSKDMWMSIKSCSTYAEAYSFSNCTEDTFNTVHAQEVYAGPYKNADELKRLIAPVSYFKMLVDCTDMPERNYVNRVLTLSPDMDTCYNDMVTELMATYNDVTTTAKSKLTALIRLQQISSGFITQRVVDEDEEDTEQATLDDPIARMYGLVDEKDILPNEIQWIGTTNPKLEALYRDVAESSKPVIIATRFTAEADRIFNELSKDYNCCLMTGWKRVGTIEEFQAGKYQVMVGNSNVIARGLNLQLSHTLLFYSNTFSLELRLQLEGRIFRIGQKNVCTYVDYVYTDTVDEKIVSSLLLKRNLLDYIRDADMKEIVK